MLMSSAVFLVAFNSSPPSSIEVFSPIQSKFEVEVDAENAYTVHFKNRSIGGDMFVWHFGDYSSSMRENPTHTYPGPGVYTAELIVLTDSSHHKTTGKVFINEP